MSDEEKDGSHPVALNSALIDAGLDSAAALGTAAFAIWLPPDVGIYAIAALPPLLKLTLSEGVRRIRGLVHHVEEQGYNFNDLVTSCEGDERKAQFVLRTIDAARAVGQDGQLRALAFSFVHGAISNDPMTVDVDTAIIRSIGALDDAHVRVLELFSRSQFDLFGLKFPNGNPELRPPESLRRNQIVEQLGSEIDQVIDGLCGELVARGLLRTVAGYVDEPWALTPLGVTVADRLKIVGEVAS